jgi:hypothetical protein
MGDTTAMNIPVPECRDRYTGEDVTKDRPYAVDDNKPDCGPTSTSNPLPNKDTQVLQDDGDLCQSEGNVVEDNTPPQELIYIRFSS